MNRRTFLAASTAIAATSIARSAEPARVISCQAYPWLTFDKREGKEFGKAWDKDLARVKQAGFDAFEFGGATAVQLRELGPILQANGLAMPSLYVIGSFHTPDVGPASVAAALASADEAKKLGCQIIVSNPSPIRWGGPENKSDEQIRYQARMMNELGRELKKRGMTLAYHNHDSELRNAGREFHHMLAGTDPEAVKFCLDAHWVWRGSGDSSVFLDDVITLYGKRVVELHLRQSKQGVWTESFGDGDLNYIRLIDRLAELGVKSPLLVMEQAVEAQTPKTLDAVAAHRKGIAALKTMLKR